MGQSSSSHHVSPEQQEVEALAASTGALPSLQKAFSLLSDPQSQAIPLDSLQKCFELTFEEPSSKGAAVSKEFLVLLSHLGSSIAGLFFVAEKGGVSWVEFLRGYTKCCGRIAASASFKNLFRTFEFAVEKAGLPTKLCFESYEGDDCKISGHLLPTDMQMFLWMCWVISCDAKKLKSAHITVDCSPPDVTHLVLSALESCADAENKLDFCDCTLSGLDIPLAASKIHMWALKTVPSLADCLAQFIYARLCYVVSHEGKLEKPSTLIQDSHPGRMCNNNLLNCGRAWAISLSQKTNINEEISNACFSYDAEKRNETLLYRSSFHGKGLNRFWSNVEGYNGPMLILIATSEDNNGTRRCIIGALTHQGFENRDSFYGTTGSLYAVSPVFHGFLPSGKEKNFVYSHLHPTGYESHPKPVGIGFGGSIGNERVFMDEDFAKVTVRHHATDKTYQPGFLIPNQGFLPHEASILEVEVWGLGGKVAKEVQASYKKREELFTEQRRKIDLKTFANWEDSPEKMMMDMVSDPTTIQREDR